MLKDRIISTLRFFDLQDYPLTLLELHRFLLSDVENIKGRIDTNMEVVNADLSADQKISLEAILISLENECREEVQSTLGFYHLPNRGDIAHLRLNNYFFGIRREKRIKKFIAGLKHLPFIRGVALGGSQALGQQKEGSDIDLLVITDSRFMWLARTFITVYFQLLGKRRHGRKIANRFCLNHYVAGEKQIKRIKNLYSAMEYARLRPLVFGRTTTKYQKNNSEWINLFFPNWQPVVTSSEKQSPVQKVLEKIFNGGIGPWLEARLKSLLLPRIKKGPFIIVEDDELSFHPDSKQQGLLESFFQR